MKFFIHLLFFLMLCLPVKAQQTPGQTRFGLGLALSRNVSITGKYWVAEKQALDFGIGSGPYSWTVYGDYLWHLPAIFGKSTLFAQQLTGYVGGGFGFSTWSNPAACFRWWCDPYLTSETGTAIFLRVPVGLEWYPKDPPLGVFLELVPYFTLTPWRGSSLDLTIGFRYYF